VILVGLPRVYADADDLAFDEDDPSLAETAPDRDAAAATGIRSFLESVVAELEAEHDVHSSAPPPRFAGRRS
jgi:hypothetical protein